VGSMDSLDSITVGVEGGGGDTMNRMRTITIRRGTVDEDRYCPSAEEPPNKSPMIQIR
jgi:hypothetical protein